MDKNSSYFTNNIYLASVLLTLGYILVDFTKKGRIFYFEFEDNNPPKNKANSPTFGIELDVEDYWNKNLLIDPLELFNNFKLLKSRIYNES